MGSVKAVVPTSNGGSSVLLDDGTRLEVTGATARAIIKCLLQEQTDQQEA
jgi:hypothetical protein